MNIRRPLIAGNWKMNGLLAEAKALSEALAAFMNARRGASFDLLICPPFTALAGAREAIRGSAVALGAQDCSPLAPGAHTGDVSALQLADAGCSWVIVGHSERRQDHGETNDLVRQKAQAALAVGMNVIICLGETEAQRDSGQTLPVVAEQLKGSLPENPSAERLVIAYEPIWAIGTGRTPTLEQVAEVHAGLRWELSRLAGASTAQALRLLYGGSVKPDNARDLLSLVDVDGALVGGASLKAADFQTIAEACVQD